MTPVPSQWRPPSRDRARTRLRLCPHRPAARRRAARQTRRATPPFLWPYPSPQLHPYEPVTPERIDQTSSNLTPREHAQAQRNSIRRHLPVTIWVANKSPLSSWPIADRSPASSSSMLSRPAHARESARRPCRGGGESPRRGVCASENGDLGPALEPPGRSDPTPLTITTASPAPSRDMGPTAPAPLHRSPPRRGHNRSLAAAPNLSIRTGPVLPARPYVRVADRRRTDLVKISNVRSRTYGRVRGQKRDRGRRWRLLSGRRRAPRLPPLRGLAGDHRRCSQRPRRSR